MKGLTGIYFLHSGSCHSETDNSNPCFSSGTGYWIVPDSDLNLSEMISQRFVLFKSLFGFWNWILDCTGFRPEFTRNDFPKICSIQKAFIKVRYVF